MRYLLVLLLGVFCYTAQAFQGLFYMNTHPKSTLTPEQQTQDFVDHADLVNVIAPRSYIIDAQGNLSASLDPVLLKTAARHHVKVMPYIVNLNKKFIFDQKQIHEFLVSRIAKERAIAQMVTECKKYNYYGLQFDFENIHVRDKDAYSQFVTDAAKALHQNKCLLSIAVMPRLHEAPTTKQGQWIFDNWLGAYDYKKLGQNADFLSVMTYNRNSNSTTPGPNAPLSWTEEVIKHMLKSVPPEKISVGLIIYSGFWGMNGDVYNDEESSTYRKSLSRIRYTTLEYPKVVRLINKIHKNPQWDPVGGCSYVMYSEKGLYNYLFIEDALAFKAKLDFIERYHLRGFSMYLLGFEDPKIWDVLAKYEPG